ncbi:hypothetical protein C8R41DRAFT_56695 [Lentinula lateritia]|uniref:F-box domain-containing protein n=1 Tax=Lentinula lateritia TaxID=40482 RepID=A0ABQ8VSA9_9AGAR|nr:hypothetical protein C8R41DRAFT_56695 [Lentinula lateritia]
MNGCYLSAHLVVDLPMNLAVEELHIHLQCLQHLSLAPFRSVDSQSLMKLKNCCPTIVSVDVGRDHWFFSDGWSICINDHYI